ncbi:MAG TPA: potassium transporter Kef [Polyangiaceae bacterium]|nr:potassium transporter Kef [Polyangiaceae bacterium]
MNAVLLLMGLLVLSYLGSFLVAGRTARGVGLPSGVEYAALGFVLGPQALDMVGGETLAAFEPVVQVALGWLAFAVGLDFGYAGERRVRSGSLALGSLGALVTGGAVAAATWLTAGRFHFGATGTERILLAGGIGAACAETTRHAVRWVVERHGARGPLADRLNELAHADDLLPLFAVAVLFALEPSRSIAVNVPLRDWPAITVGLGVLLGACAALLTRSELRLEDAWGLLFGVALIGIGASARLGLSTLTASFFAGLAASVLSRHGRELRAMVAPTERPVLLPALLLAGARLDFHASDALPWIAAAAIGARVLAKVVIGWALAAAAPAARKGGVLVGLSLLSSGALSMSIGLVFALRFPGVVGDTVLVVAVLSATVGEFVGPVRLRRALQMAGEIDGAPSSAAWGTRA